VNDLLKPASSFRQATQKMPDYQTSIIRRTLPEATFELLRNLWQQMAYLAGEGALVLTEDVFLSIKVSQPQSTERFTVLVSERFSALLVGNSISPDLNNLKQGVSVPHTSYPLLQVGLTFEREAIASFLTQISQYLENSPFVLNLLQTASQTQTPNDATIQSQFTLSLIEILSSDRNATDARAAVSTPELPYTDIAACQPIEDALRQQVEQERLLNQVITQMRQSLELPVILETTVEQVRSFLEVDRLVIYQFDVHPDRIRPNENMTVAETPGRGRVTYESLTSDTIPSVLHWAEEKYCFVDVPNVWEKYRKGNTYAVEDIETEYVLSPCFVKLMRRTQVRAKVIAPIVVQEKLWGLLIAHQCYEPRHWQDIEKSFLRQIGEHLAIAIYQAELYAQVQQQKQTLEARVISRTQELHDALLVAEAASRSKSEFLAAMSHELRTPLTCIIGLSSTLLRWPFGELSQKQQNYLQTIYDSGEHLLDLINEILALSEVEAGKAILNISEFSLSKLAQESLQLLTDKALGSDIHLEMDLQIQPSRDRFIGDSKRVKQILLNLLSNAVKFTPNGGQVTLRVWVEDNTAILQVEDTGIGIPEDRRSLLFQKFQQLDFSYHRQYEGIGLGLALTKQLVELHGGRIDVESTVDIGSTFTVWLPSQSLATAALTSSTDVVMPPAHSPPKSIVLISNHEEVATLICNILTVADYQVVWLLEGSTAIEQIQLLQPNAVIVDLNLPGMAGYEIIHSLHNSPATQHIKALVLTSKEIAENQQPGMEDIADDYLLKPVQPDQLLHKVATLMAT
jgi:two-component system sensor histidine kinase/response regulator